jgi:tripartite-type tricarboxylate transporter receptor subunit TctC
MKRASNSRLPYAPLGKIMKLPRRQFLYLAASTIAFPAASHKTWAQSYPTRPVRMIVPFGPGGGTDIVARLIGQWLTERLGQTFVIENRPGAGGNLGTEAVVRAPPDGYTLALIGAPSAINATLYDNLTFNFIREETSPGGRIVRTIGIVRARAKIGLQNLTYNIRRLMTLERIAAA